MTLREERGAWAAAQPEALRRFPEVNASIDGNDVVYHGYFDIGIAVSSPRGLVVPILRDADALGLAEIEGRKPRRRRKPKRAESEAPAEQADAETAKEAVEQSPAEPAGETEVEEDATVEAVADLDDETAAAPVAEDVAAEDAPKRANRASNVTHSSPVVTSGGSKAENDDEEAKPKRGWWNRRGFF